MFEGRDPIYQQIADQIRDDVVRGALGEDEQVMSTTQYATRFRINPATAAKAFAQLVDDGVLYKRRGVGMFVARGAREALCAVRRDQFFVDVLDPALHEADLLGINPDDIIARVRVLPRSSAEVAP